MQTIDAFEGKPLLECVAAGVAIENRIAKGKHVSSNSSGLSQGKIAFIAGRKTQEVERFRLRVERQHIEKEQLSKSEQLVATRHVSNLDAAEKSLRELRSEEVRIRMELAKVDADAQQQRALLEKILQENGQKPRLPPFTPLLPHRH